MPSGDLVELRIRLPAEIPTGAALGDLMQAGEQDGGSNCGGSFRIDPIGFAD